MKRTLLAGVSALFGLLGLAGTHEGCAAEAGEPLRIGLASDLNGVYATLGGSGSLVAAQMAIEDFGSVVLGRKIEVLQGDTQNKPDVGAGIVREWFNRQGVRAVFDGSASSVALVIQTAAKDTGRMFVASGSFTSELVGASCTSSTMQFVPNTRGLAVGGLQQAVADGVDSWFFLTPNYAFGQAMQRDGTAFIEAAKGKVVGSALHPLGQSDLSAYLVLAQSSGAKALAVASAGTDLVNAVKQIGEFGLRATGMRVYGMLVNFSDIEALGSEAEGLRFVTPTYWAMNDATKAWSTRFMARHGGHQPTMVHSETYSAITHYLKAVKAAGTDDTGAVLSAMRASPVNDVFTDNAVIRADGRLMNDLYVAEVKSSSGLADKRDNVAIGSRIKADKLYDGPSACPLLQAAK